MYPTNIRADTITLVKWVFIEVWCNANNTCCLLLKTCARCFPTSAERFRHTHQGLSMTLAAASKDAGQVRAVNMPGQCDVNSWVYCRKGVNIKDGEMMVCFLHDHTSTWEDCVLQSLLGHNADQPIQQRGHGWAQILEETWLPHQAVLFSTLTQAGPRGLEWTWKTAVVFLCLWQRNPAEETTERLLHVKGFLANVFEVGTKLVTECAVCCRGGKAALFYVSTNLVICLHNSMWLIQWFG